MTTTTRTRNLNPAELKPAQVTAIVDTREQIPLDLKALLTMRGTLQTADYSILGLEHVIALERKSLSDLLGCVGVERERFEREVQRLLAYPVRALVVEATWPDLEQGEWRSKVTPAAADRSRLVPPRMASVPPRATQIGHQGGFRGHNTNSDKMEKIL